MKIKVDVSNPISSETILTRLENLWRKLDDEGRYVDANTIALAIEQIKKGS